MLKPWKALATHVELMACFESLKAADYAFTMATLQFMEKSFPEIVNRAQAIKTGEIVAPEDKAFFESGASFLTGFADGIRGGMESAEPPVLFQLMKKPGTKKSKSAGLIPPFIGVAHADVNSMLDNVAWALTSSAKEMGRGLYGIGSAAEKTQAAVKEQLLKEMEKEADKQLSQPVHATGSFSGEYKGNVSMTLIPGGGPVNGSVSTKFGSATISGSVSKDGSISASVSGTMSYDWYADGVHATKKSCGLSGNISGTVGNRRVSGSYSTSCGDQGVVNGNWVAKW